MGQPEGSTDGERQLIIEFGRRLREARRQAGLSQAEVAARLGIRQGYVSRVELGAENITLSACVRFAQAVGCLFSPEFRPPTPRDSEAGIAEFAQRLREARRRAGLSQAALAARLGITQASVSRVERGAQNLTLAACEAFADAVGCTFSTILMPKPRRLQ
ncbi:MAG TPA: helix-turn-helix transcriptional regulator [Stellaceae bacterium]|nr:helix-turn-helix transcriptional regulator [Stellaceae bacterium]